MILTRVHSWDEEDIAWLERGLETWPLGANFQSVVEEIQEGFYQLWRVEAPAEGIVLTQIIQHPYGRELHVKTLAGKRIIRNLDAIFEVLRAYGREHGCKWVGGDANSPQLFRVYERFGAKPMAVNFLKEIADG